jgi:hypothetical protein
MNKKLIAAVAATALAFAEFDVGAGIAHASLALEGCPSGTFVVPGDTAELTVEGYNFAEVQVVDGPTQDVIGQRVGDGPVTVTWPASWGPGDHLIESRQQGSTYFPACFVAVNAPTVAPAPPTAAPGPPPPEGGGSGPDQPGPGECQPLPMNCHGRGPIQYQQ